MIFSKRLGVRFYLGLVPICEKNACLFMGICVIFELIFFYVKGGKLGRKIRLLSWIMFFVWEIIGSRLASGDYFHQLK